MYYEPGGCIFFSSLLSTGILLPYPSDNLVLDVVLLVLFLGLETLRIFYGDNKLSSV